MNAPNELRLFISSTFQDLQEEREHLIKKIFPEIRSLCRERGIRFTEVDLRWGLTDEDVALGQVIRTCLDEVDKCRPYFIGITGDRYGFIPSYLDVQKDPQLLEQHPWIEEAAIDGMSITEMEAQYAVLRNDEGDRMRDEAGRARFYFRRHRESLDDNRELDEERRRLEDFQRRIRDSGAHVAEFRDTDSLGELIYDDLINIINRDFADAQPPTPLEAERARHAAFSLSRRRAYIPNPLHVKRLNDHVTSDDPPLVVYAESGSGKSALLAYWAEQYRRKHPETQIIEHYVGIGATATAHYGIIQHICMEINERYGRDEEIPSDPAKLETALGQWLGYADHALRRATHGDQQTNTESNHERAPTLPSDSSFGVHPSSFTVQPSSLIIVLDGLNQLQENALKLHWIPDVISPSIRLILSSTVEGTLVELQKRGWVQLGMQAITEVERETIIVRYLAEYSKSLNAEQIKRIATNYKCGHPLFLKTLLEELRLVGRHEELDAMITSYLEATGTEDLFQLVLQRLEEDHDRRVVRDLMSLLGASRGGLDERELSELSGLAPLKIVTLIAGLEYHLVRKGGHLTFFHDYLRRAVVKRYLDDERGVRGLHLRIAAHYQQEVDASTASGTLVSTRTASELGWHLHAAGDEDRLAVLLTNMDVFLSLYEGETAYEVLGYWSSMEAGTGAAGMYRLGLANWRMEEAEERSRGMGRVSNLLEWLGRWMEAIELERERLALAIEHDLGIEEATARRRIGSLLIQRGSYTDAYEQLQQALERFTELGDRGGACGTISNIGTLYVKRADYERAMECYQQVLRVTEELRDRSGMSVVISNMAEVYASRGDYDQAIECLQKQLRIAEELGDRKGAWYAIGNIGTVYNCRGEDDRAMDCYERTLRFAEELGDRKGVCYAIGNIGEVYSRRGDFDRAMEYCERRLQIAEELGDRRTVCATIGDMSEVYFNRGEFDRVMECCERWLHMAEELGDRRGVSRAICNMGGVFYNRGENDRAMECYDRQLRIAEELGDRSGASLANGNMGEVYFRRGEHDRALEVLDRAANESRAIGERHVLVEWLWNIGAVLVESARSETMPAYLPTYVAGATTATWRARCLERARACAEECMALSEQLNLPRTLFSSRVLLLRIEAADDSGGDALQRLAALFGNADDDAQRAELHYWLWKLGERDHAPQARALYEALHAARPQFEYQKRIEELGVSPSYAR